MKCSRKTSLTTLKHWENSYLEFLKHQYTYMSQYCKDKSYLFYYHFKIWINMKYSPNVRYPAGLGETMVQRLHPGSGLSASYIVKIQI